MCLHCVTSLSKDELFLWSLSNYSQTFLEFLFTTGPPVGRKCIHVLRPVLRREVYPVMDTSTEGTVASQQQLEELNLME